MKTYNKARITRNCATGVTGHGLMNGERWLRGDPENLLYVKNMGKEGLPNRQELGEKFEGRSAPHSYTKIHFPRSK